jgi:hypothetical protein
MGIAVVVLAALVGSVFVVPLRDWWRQGDDLGRREQELATLLDVNARLEREITGLKTPEGAVRAAREELGFVVDGEQRISLIDRGGLPGVLPSGWPYSVVDGIVATRLAPAPESGE